MAFPHTPRSGCRGPRNQTSIFRPHIKEQDMMHTTRIAVGIAMGVTLVVGGLVWSKDRGQDKQEENKQVVAMATVATVTVEQAIKTALENFPGKVIEAELGKKQDKTVWEVEILTAEQGLMVVHIDAGSGLVINTEEK
ncbi:MAG: hypothetical protein EPO61_09555 [Nitrospirae bacterium]|nr:MAG: hypothetical protein EPO61_09555 [Nitrospirota bacterium]